MQGTALATLELFADFATPYLEDIATILHHQDENLRREAVRALGKLNIGCQSSHVHVMEALLDDAVGSVRVAAAKALLATIEGCTAGCAQRSRLDSKLTNALPST